MAQHVADQAGHVLRQGVVAAAHEGERARAFDQADGRARAGAEGQVLANVGEVVAIGPARRAHQLDRVLHQRRIDVDLAAFLLQLAELAHARDRRHRHRRAGDALGDHELLFLARVVDQHLHHEAVDLRFGQRIGALGLDRVLRRHDEERLGHLVGLAGDRHLALLHHLEQRALHLGRRAIDLVGEQQVGEDRAERGRELAGARIVDARADQVGRHQVGRELDPLEGAAQRLRQRLDGQRLGQPRHAFDQQVALRQHRDHDALEEVVLADDDALDLVEHALHQRCRFARNGRGVGHRRLGCREEGDGLAPVRRRDRDALRTAAFRRPTRHFRSARRSRCR